MNNYIEKKGKQFLIVEWMPTENIKEMMDLENCHLANVVLIDSANNHQEAEING